jgi:hypothetical protein
MPSGGLVYVLHKKTANNVAVFLNLTTLNIKEVSVLRRRALRPVLAQKLAFLRG